MPSFPFPAAALDCVRQALGSDQPGAELAGKPAQYRGAPTEAAQPRAKQAGAGGERDDDVRNVVERCPGVEFVMRKEVFPRPAWAKGRCGLPASMRVHAAIAQATVPSAGAG